MPTLSYSTGIVSSFKFSNLHHTLRTDSLKEIEVLVGIGYKVHINHLKLLGRVPHSSPPIKSYLPRNTKIMDKECRSKL